MGDVEAFVWFDDTGRIVAVGHVPAGAVEDFVEPVAKAGHKVARLKLPEEILPSLHLTHTIDVERDVLCARDSSESA